MNDVNSLLLKEPEDPHEAVFQAICPHLNKGFDMQGFPIYIERTGRVDVHKLTSVLSFDLVVKRQREFRVSDRFSKLPHTLQIVRGGEFSAHGGAGERGGCGGLICLVGSCAAAE